MELLDLHCPIGWVSDGCRDLPSSDVPGVQGLTEIKFLTDGVLLRELAEDPLLSAYRCACASSQPCRRHECHHPVTMPNEV